MKKPIRRKTDKLTTKTVEALKAQTVFEIKKLAEQNNLFSLSITENLSRKELDDILGILRRLLNTSNDVQFIVLGMFRN